MKFSNKQKKNVFNLGVNVDMELLRNVNNQDQTGFLSKLLSYHELQATL